MHSPNKRQRCSCTNTSSVYKTSQLPNRFEHPGTFCGYGVDRDMNYAYYTSSSEYGKFPPTIHTVPLRYYSYNYELSRQMILMGRRSSSPNY